MDEVVELRQHGDDTLPNLVFLPGLHGDWTLVGGLRARLAGRVRFVEATYPRTSEWSLEDYAAAMDRALASAGVSRGWLLAESYGSQIAWAMLAREGRFRVQGLILAGGFVRHPCRTEVRLGRWVLERLPLAWLLDGLKAYAAYARRRRRHEPAIAAELQEFLARRTESDRRAATHRLRLIAEADWRATARTVQVPVYYLTGFVDPIVPWPLVRYWLGRQCAAFRGWRLVWQADHNVLGSAPNLAAEQILQWMRER